MIDRRGFVQGLAAAGAALALPGIPEARAAVLTGGQRLIRFAHLTDLHFTNRPQNRYPTSYYHVRQAVQDLNDQDLDFVLFTGDMFHFPEDIGKEMPALKEALAGLKVPYYCCIGNHDAEGDGVAARKRFVRDHLGDQGLSRGDNYYHFSPTPGVRFVMLDSTDIEGDAYHCWTGHMSERQFRWLEETLKASRDETVLIGMHHAPKLPYPFLTKLRFLEDSQHKLETLLKRFPNVQTIFSGHFHFGGRNRFANAEMLLGPSLVEHPHPYRIFELLQQGPGQGALSYAWKSLNLHASADDACAHGTAGLRSFGLLALSYDYAGSVPLVLTT